MSNEDLLRGYQGAGVQAPSVREDVARSMAAAPAKAAISLAGLPEQLAGWGAQGLGYLTGRDPESFRDQGADRLPSAQAIRSAGEEKFGPLYEPQTPAGKLAGTATEWGLMGPRVVPKLIGGKIGKATGHVLQKLQRFVESS